MGKVRFRGGMSRKDGKDRTKEKPIMVLHPKTDMVYPLSQHIGLPAKPVVEVGDNVLVGQRIAVASGVVSANILSSVSGKVKAIEERKTVSGDWCESIVIANDGAYQTIEGFGVEREYAGFSKTELRACIKDAGIVGLGGVGFPTHVKLTPKNDDSIQYVIVNGVECEPFLTADYRMMLEESEKLVGGLKILLRLFENAKGVIALDKRNKACIRSLSALIKNEPRIVIKKIKGTYPQGAERMLIYKVTGRKLNSSMIPTDVGCVVNNAGTVLAVYKAVAESEPPVSRVVTVSGTLFTRPHNFLVPLGTPMEEVAAAAGGLGKKPGKIVVGGPMTGRSPESLDVPVTKQTSALLAFSKDEMGMAKESPCIRCGRCVTVCPERLVPMHLFKMAERSDKKKFADRGGMECCDCGACTYVCPAGKNLAETIRQTRRSILDERRKR